MYFLDSASIDNPFVLTDQIDMSDLDMDLTGISGLEVNQVPAHFLVESNESSESFTVEPTDSVTISVSFVDLVPKYARGYFGSHTFSDTLGFGLAPMKKIIGGTVDVDSIDLTLTVKNGFNLIAQSTISKLTGINTRTAGVVNLSFPNLGESININPASGGLWTMTPSQRGPVALRHPRLTAARGG